jgi:uncharacterized protein
MLTGELPATLDLTRIGPGGADLKTDLPTAGMERLRQAVAVAEVVSARLRVRRDEAGQMPARVDFRASVTMTCQRCLGPVTLDIEQGSELLLAPDPVDAAAEPEGRDVVVAPGWRLDVAGLIEDELLLALPLVPRHESEQHCVERDRHFGPPGEAAPERENPFAALSRLRRGERDDDEQSGDQ